MPNNTLRTKLIRLAHENPSLRPEILPLLKTAAEEILVQDLPPAQTKIVAAVEKNLNVKTTMAWGGVHGYIVEFTFPTQRMTIKELRDAFSGEKIRWVTFQKDGISVGM